MFQELETYFLQLVVAGIGFPNVQLQELRHMHETLGGKPCAKSCLDLLLA